MQKTLENLSRISLFFLVFFGGPHLASTFLIAQGVESRFIWIIFHSFDLPFLISAIIYGICRFSLTTVHASGNGKWSLILGSALGIVILILALYLNFFVPDAFIQLGHVQS